MWVNNALKKTIKVAMAIIIMAMAAILTFDFFPNTFLFNLKYRRGSYEADPHLSSSLFRIAIIGSAGYIGSRLMNYLPKEKNWTAIGYDRIFPGQASYEISMRDLRSFQVVIYLGGLTGRAMCRDYPSEVDRENIEDIYLLAKRMLPSQLLIFMSTSTIAEGSGSVSANEDFPVQLSLLDSYASSLFRREQTLRHLAFTFRDAPIMIGLRSGIVVGLSPSQRTDLGPIALVCQAFLTGRLHVTHPESNRAFLSMEDLMRAVIVVIKRFKHAKRFDIFHLQSFSASISNLTNSIAHLTGAHVDAFDHAVHQDGRGFSLNNTKFRTTFDFVFEDNLDQLLSKLIDNVPQMCPGRESRLDNDSIPCVVCGSHKMHTVLDLHQQPLANNIKTNLEDSIQSKRFPLRLVRCPVCHHTQLSYIVDRKYVFSQYSYQSGTSERLQNHFAWLAGKTINESTIINGTVLEIACNDGSQLNEFRKRGWKTVGVDAAKNLADIARRQGHIVHTGFWGIDDFPSMSSLDSLDVIIAQNVLAYVDNPIQFVRACAAMMSITTKLYIQTSQCDMYETGQFDTVYHKHVSFFTAHSFKKLADTVGLTMTNFEIVPMYGRSCLVTFQQMKSSNTSTPTSPIKLVPSLSLALEKERNLVMNTSWFYIKYQAQAEAMRRWIHRQLTFLQGQHHTIVAYGAANKDLVLLHFLLEIIDRSWNISFVIEDTLLKQNTFCPGTSIPVRPITELSKCDSTNPLTIVVFAWNFWDEISRKISHETIEKGFKNVFIMLPFPEQQLLNFDKNSSKILVQNSIKPLRWPLTSPSKRRPVLLVAHFFNEEFLLPYWIRHHSSMFDMAILIDYNSTDESVQIIRREAPKTWQIVSSRNSWFEGERVDKEVMDYEKTHPNAWKIALNIPEFLIHYHFRDLLIELEKSDNATMVFRFRCLKMSGNDSVPFKRFTSLVNQRSQYYYDPQSPPEERMGVSAYARFLHRYPFGNYTTGRHGFRDAVWKWVPIGFIAKYNTNIHLGLRFKIVKLTALRVRIMLTLLT